MQPQRSAWEGRSRAARNGNGSFGASQSPAVQTPCSSKPQLKAQLKPTWILWGPGLPPLMTGDSLGSTAMTCRREREREKPQERSGVGEVGLAGWGARGELHAMRQLVNHLGLSATPASLSQAIKC